MSSIYCKKHSLGSLGKCTTPSEGNGIWDAAKKINDKYNIKHVIGSGYFAQVRLAESKEFPGNFYAIKIIDKNKLKGKEDSLKAEICICNRLRHPNIVEVFEVYEDPTKVYLVMELESGGELFDYIEERGSYTEKDAAHVIRQVLSAVGYMHSQGIVHRDLKTENLLYHSKDKDSKIMLCDFGVSKISDTGIMTTLCGTSRYVAPEVLERKPYGKAVDLWSIGVITYILLCGYPPFYDENDANLLEQILEGEIVFDSPYWDEISNEAKEFICQLMNIDPDKRPSCEEAKKHAWIKAATSRVNLKTSVSEQFKKNFAKSHWKQAFNTITACRQLKLMASPNKHLDYQEEDQTREEKTAN